MSSMAWAGGNPKTSATAIDKALPFHNRTRDALDDFNATRQPQKQQPCFGVIGGD